MKKKIIISIASTCIICAGIGTYFLLSHFSTKNDDSTIYVQKVSSLTGSFNTQNRYSGIVESQDTLDIAQDASKTITNFYVEVGQEVKKGDKLFTYDVSEAQNAIQQKQLDIEAQNNEITAQNNTISDYNEELKNGGDKIEIQARINDANYAIRQAQNTIKATQTEITQLNNQIHNSTVTSTIDGIIKEVNIDGGTDANGNTKPIISITQTGEYRIKGTLTEMGMLSEGSDVIVRSRIDEDKVYTGTITKVDTDPQTDNNNYYTNSSDAATKYPFYVSLDTSDGLMLGQHVYIELNNGQNTLKSGIWLDSSFICYDDNQNPYVWVSEKDHLKKRNIQIGDIDDETYTTQITSGLQNTDYIAWPDETFQEGLRTTSEMESE